MSIFGEIPEAEREGIILELIKEEKGEIKSDELSDKAKELKVTIERLIDIGLIK